MSPTQELVELERGLDDAGPWPEPFPTFFLKTSVVFQVWPRGIGQSRNCWFLVYDKKKRMRVKSLHNNSNGQNIQTHDYFSVDSFSSCYIIVLFHSTAG